MSRHWHDLHSPASRTSLYLRAASKRSISGDQLPDDGLRCFIRVQPGNLAAYRRLCHFTDDGRLPAVAGGGAAPRRKPGAGGTGGPGNGQNGDQGGQGGLFD